MSDFGEVPFADSHAARTTISQLYADAPTLRDVGHGGDGIETATAIADRRGNRHEA